MFKPSYLKLLENGDLLEKVREAKKHQKNCKLCPHECEVTRGVTLGFCCGGDKAVISSFGPHFGEEAPLVGRNGSGTIFFGYCNMRCVYCQNYKLSFKGEGSVVSNEMLAQIMLKLQNERKCHNINLVSPTHFVVNILEAVYIAAQKGLKIPLVYNSGGYENTETLKMLEDVVDIYMPDFKYYESDRGQNYSNVRFYAEKVKRALKEMDRQVGGLKTDERGIAYRGLIIRHLILPQGLNDTKKVLKFIAQNLSKDCLVNLMDQYYPANKAFEYEEISRQIDYSEYKKAYIYAKKLGLRLSKR